MLTEKTKGHVGKNDSDEKQGGKGKKAALMWFISDQSHLMHGIFYYWSRVSETMTVS